MVLWTIIIHCNKYRLAKAQLTESVNNQQYAHPPIS